MDGEVSFFSLNKKTDWAKGCVVNIQVSDEGLRLKNTEKYAVSRTISLENLDAVMRITDFTTGKPGQLYLLDDRASLLVYDYKNEQIDVLYKPDHGLFTNQAAIAFSRDVIYLADPAGDRKVLALSTANGQIMWSLHAFDNIPFQPLAIAADGGQYVYVVASFDTAAVLNGDAEIPAGGRLGIVKIDQSGKVIRVLQNKNCRISRLSNIAYLRKSIAVAVAKEGPVYVLDAANSTIYGFSEEEALCTQLALPSKTPSGFGIDTRQHFYAGDGREIGLDAEDDRFVLKFGPTGESPEKVPGFRGKSDKLLLDRNDRLYIWNRETSSITVLERKPKILEMDFTGLPHGIYFSAAVDSTVTEMYWHKLTLDVDVPENTQIKVSYFSSDRKTISIDGRLTDLDEYIKDDTVSPREKIKALDTLWSAPVINPADALMHGAKGRYIWLKIEFVGSEERTPLLKKVRIYYPRSSYLRYLPAVYQEDPKSRDFLERFLALFETFFSDMEEKIGAVARYFDVDTVSGPFLKWLAEWLAISVDDSWSEGQVKKLMKKAPELYKLRGTKKGIEEIIEIYTGEKPFIIEYFQYKHLKENPELKELVAQLYGTDPYCFCVLVKQERVPTAQQHLVVQQLLNREKPAFTEARLVVLQPWIYVDMHTYLGINTYLSELALLRLDQGSSIPYSTVVIDVDLDNRVGVHTRLGLDAEVK